MAIDKRTFIQFIDRANEEIAENNTFEAAYQLRQMIAQLQRLMVSLEDEGVTGMPTSVDALARIKTMITPVVTVDSFEKIASGFKAEIRHSYKLCPGKNERPADFVHVFTVLADEKGGAYFYPGLFS